MVIDMSQSDYIKQVIDRSNKDFIIYTMFVTDNYCWYMFVGFISCMWCYFVVGCYQGIGCLSRMFLVIGPMMVFLVRILQYCIVVKNLFLFRRCFLEYLFISMSDQALTVFFIVVVLWVLQKSRKNHLIQKQLYFDFNFLLKISCVISHSFIIYSLLLFYD